MRKILFTAMLLLLLAGCGAAKRIGASPEDSSTPASTPGSAYVPLPESEPGVSALIPASSSAPSSPPAASEASPGAAPESGTVSGKETEESGEPSDSCDAAEAVSVEPVDGGIRVVFEQLPQTTEDLEALLSLYPQSDARHTAAFFIASLVRYVDSSDDGLAMIDLLRGPQPMNGTEINFLKDRLREKSYLPAAYFEGASPGNDYTPDAPWTLVIYDDPMNAEEGYFYVQAATTGADSRRRITLREKDGLYYLWEYSNILTGIRLPASLDPWL